MHLLVDPHTYCNYYRADVFALARYKSRSDENNQESYVLGDTIICQLPTYSGLP